MNYFKFNIGGTEFTIEDLGGALNQEFLYLHEHFLLAKPFNYSQFEKAAHSYFDSHVGDWSAHDAFFNNFTIIWRWLIEVGRFAAAEQVWEFALASAISWENSSSRRLHKGTPYYFWGMTVVLRGDVDRGFLLMHQALTEDIESSGNPFPDTPASAFVTLDHQKLDQAFRNNVQEIADFIDESLNQYRLLRGKALTINQFRSRLFHIADLRDAVFSLVFTSFRMKTILKEVRPALRMNEFAGLLEVGLLFDICLVIDSLIRYKNPGAWKFLDQTVYLSSCASLNLSRQRLQELNSKLGNDFQDFPSVANDILNGTFTCTDGYALNPTEADVALAYGIRNLAAHRVDSFPIIYGKFEETYRRIMNVLFLTVEYLY